MALPRGPELDQRYLTHLRRLVDAGVEVIAATQDPAMHESLARTGLVDGIAEVEMLHGVRPDLLRALRDRGVPVRVLGVYGQNWWLHFLHRLAEHPRPSSPPWPTSPTPPASSSAATTSEERPMTETDRIKSYLITTFAPDLSPTDLSDDYDLIAAASSTASPCSASSPGCPTSSTSTSTRWSWPNTTSSP
ncbi:hypothetical protein ACFQV2_07820 [Actinokineospora soli]|uniref:Uncharacterized protein n=1 Tax=Actinokineospora soli TaxID=1048753 RepID=A0ABW2TK65_9PSEU